MNRSPRSTVLSPPRGMISDSYRSPFKQVHQNGNKENMTPNPLPVSPFQKKLRNMTVSPRKPSFNGNAEHVSKEKLWFAEKSTLLRRIQDLESRTPRRVLRVKVSDEESEEEVILRMEVLRDAKKAIKELGTMVMDLAGRVDRAEAHSQDVTETLKKKTSELASIKGELCASCEREENLRNTLAGIEHEEKAMVISLKMQVGHMEREIRRVEQERDVLEANSNSMRIKMDEQVKLLQEHEAWRLARENQHDAGIESVKAQAKALSNAQNELMMAAEREVEETNAELEEAHHANHQLEQSNTRLRDAYKLLASQNERLKNKIDTLGHDLWEKQLSLHREQGRAAAAEEVCRNIGSTLALTRIDLKREKRAKKRVRHARLELMDRALLLKVSYENAQRVLRRVKQNVECNNDCTSEMAESTVTDIEESSEASLPDHETASENGDFQSPAAAKAATKSPFDHMVVDEMIANIREGVVDSWRMMAWCFVVYIALMTME